MMRSNDECRRYQNELVTPIIDISNFSCFLRTQKIEVCFFEYFHVIHRTVLCRALAGQWHKASDLNVASRKLGCADRSALGQKRTLPTSLDWRP